MNTVIQNKIKNISLATNYLSEYVSDNYPIKKSLKRYAVIILDYNSALSDISRIKISELGHDLETETVDGGKKLLLMLRSDLSALLDLVDLARVDDSVSEMNARIYSEGVLNFIGTLSDSVLLTITNNTTNQKIVSERLIELFSTDVSNVENNRTKDTVVRSDVVKEKILNEINKKSLLEIEYAKDKEARDDTLIISDVKLETKELETKSNILKSSPLFQTIEQSESTQRRAVILSVLAVGGNSVNDIKYKFPQYSIKTLQRDISEMMDEKKIVRIGEKRWAKYYLK